MRVPIVFNSVRTSLVLRIEVRIVGQLPLKRGSLRNLLIIFQVVKIIRLAFQQLEGGFLRRVLKGLLRFDQMPMFLFVALAKESLVEFLICSFALAVGVCRLFILRRPEHGVDALVRARQLREPWFEVR